MLCALYLLVNAVFFSAYLSQYSAGEGEGETEPLGDKDTEMLGDREIERLGDRLGLRDGVNEKERD